MRKLVLPNPPTAYSPQDQREFRRALEEQVNQVANIPSPDPVPKFVALTIVSGATLWATAGAAVSNATLALSANTTLTITGAVNGAEGYLEVTQDSTTAHTLTLPAGDVVGATLTVSPTLSKKTAIGWIYNGIAFVFVLARQT